jgi:hypothetical protein
MAIEVKAQYYVVLDLDNTLVRPARTCNYDIELSNGEKYCLGFGSVELLALLKSRGDTQVSFCSIGPQARNEELVRELCARAAAMLKIDTWESVVHSMDQTWCKDLKSLGYWMPRTILVDDVEPGFIVPDGQEGNVLQVYPLGHLREAGVTRQQRLRAKYSVLRAAGILERSRQLRLEDHISLPAAVHRTQWRSGEPLVMEHSEELYRLGEQVLQQVNCELEVGAGEEPWDVPE